MDVAGLVHDLPSELRRTILRHAYRGMTIDQRRAAGILPGRLAIPEGFVKAFKDRTPIVHCGYREGPWVADVCFYGKFAYRMRVIQNKGEETRHVCHFCTVGDEGRQPHWIYF